MYSGDNGATPTAAPSSRTMDSTLGDPMDLTPPASISMGPPSNSSPEMEHVGELTNGSYHEPTPSAQTAANCGVSAAAATSVQQPKVVQTAFIHKLYKYGVPWLTARSEHLLTYPSMLEDSSIQHLISWSNNNESFVMSPSTDFSRVLS